MVTWISVVAMEIEVEEFQDTSWGAVVKKGSKQGDSQGISLSEWEDGNAISFKGEDQLMWLEGLWKPLPLLSLSHHWPENHWDQLLVKFECCFIILKKKQPQQKNVQNLY